MANFAKHAKMHAEIIISDLLGAPVPFKMVVAALTVIFVVCGCNSVPTQQDISPSSHFQAAKVMSNVLDDDHGLVYLKADRTEVWDESVALNDVMAKHRAWQEKYPNKKVVSITSITGSWGSGRGTATTGLLIRYEKSNSK